MRLNLHINNTFKGGAGRRLGQNPASGEKVPLETLVTVARCHNILGRLGVKDEVKEECWRITSLLVIYVVQCAQ